MNLKDTEYENVNWMHKRPITSFLKDGNVSSGSIKSAELLYQLGNGFASSLFNSVRSLQKTNTRDSCTANAEETDLSNIYVTLSEMANICSYWQINTVKWKPFHCHLEAHHRTNVVLRTCV
jgi:hypothetical protein